MNLSSEQRSSECYYQLAPKRQNRLSKVVQSYYIDNDVFKRDEKYYDQLPDHQRKRVEKSLSQSKENNQKQIEVSNDESRCNQTVWVESPRKQTLHEEQGQEEKERQLLRQEYRKLRSELQELGQELNNGGYDSYTVIKKSYYISSPENLKIKQQEAKIIQLKEKVANNYSKIEKYKKGIAYMQQKLTKIKKIDSEIFGQIKSLGAKDRYLQEKVKADLRTIAKDRFAISSHNTCFCQNNQGQFPYHGQTNFYQSRHIPQQQVMKQEVELPSSHS